MSTKRGYYDFISRIYSEVRNFYPYNKYRWLAVVRNNKQIKCIWKIYVQNKAYIKWLKLGFL